MKSRITIEVDFDNSNSPVIQILHCDSDDVRDKIVKNFCEQVGGSSWLNIKWRDGVMSAEPNSLMFSRIIISPIPESKLKEQAEIMLEQDRINKGYSNSALKSK